jgi:hypothetical protein
MKAKEEMRRQTKREREKRRRVADRLTGGQITLKDEKEFQTINRKMRKVIKE